MLVLKNAVIFDGVSEKPIKNHVVVVEGKVIKEIKPDTGENFDQARIIDLEGFTLSPGFIDCHMHPFMQEITHKDKRMNDSLPGGTRLPNGDFYIAYRGVPAVQKALYSGFTTVFDGGGINNMDIALRDAIALDYIEGPDYYTCGQQITAWPAHHTGLSTVAAGPYEMRKAIRERLFWAVDHIKIENSAPARAYGRTMEKSAFTMEELLAAVDEAHSAGLKVSMHCRGADSVVDAVKAGTDAVVHATGISDEGIELMLKNGTWLYTTLAVIPSVPDPQWMEAKPTRVAEMMKAVGKLQEESLRRAYKAGVKFALASDWGLVTSYFGENYREMLQMRNLGMSNFECLKTGTSDAAKALGLEDRGVIKQGYKADFVAFKDSPLENLETISDARLVIKSGKIIKNELNPQN